MIASCHIQENNLDFTETNSEMGNITQTVTDSTAEHLNVFGEQSDVVIAY